MCFTLTAVAVFHHQALAKELSAKGKAAAEAMWAAHERASSQIYQQRNTRLQAQAASKGSSAAAAAVIDLHGRLPSMLQD
jgi:hypothetical protein